jgi:GH43 family beta-xylosidase
MIWRKHARGPMSHHIWAPELHHIDGRWYIHFAAGRAEAIWDIRMYVLENSGANPLEGDWIEKGQIRTAWETFSLDATTFEHRGVRYLVWAQKDPDIRGNTNLYIARMDTPWSIVQPQVMLTQPEFEWEQIGYWVNEGPAVLIRNGRVFLTYSASATDANYCIGLLTADEGADLLDPASWTKSPVQYSPRGPSTGQYGPGHNSFTTTPDGATDILIYHARNYGRIEGEALARSQSSYPCPSPPLERGRHAELWDCRCPTARCRSRMADKPLFRDPVHDGAADPVVIWNEAAQTLVDVLHQSPRQRGRVVRRFLGARHAHWHRRVPRRRVLVVCGHGGDRTARGTRRGGIHPLGAGGHRRSGRHLSDVFDGGSRRVRDLATPAASGPVTSTDLRHWGNARPLELASDRVIDAAVLRLADGTWRLWYNNERDGKAIYYADSPDLVQWTDRGKAVGDQGGEGPKVFWWHDTYWMITDVWDGLAVYHSPDALRLEPAAGRQPAQQPRSRRGRSGQGRSRRRGREPRSRVLVLFHSPRPDRPPCGG